METIDHPPFAAVAAFTSVHEAQLAQSVLEAAGIPNLLENEHVISMNWTYSNAVGGVRVVVPADRIDEALALLTTDATLATEAEPAAKAASDSHASDSCRQCGCDEFDSMLPGKSFSVLTGSRSVYRWDRSSDVATAAAAARPPNVRDPPAESRVTTRRPSLRSAELS